MTFSRIGLRGQDDKIRLEAISDKGLASIEDVRISGANSRRLHASQIRSRPRFRHGNCPHQGTVRRAGKPLETLLLVCGNHVRHNHVVVQRDAHCGSASPRAPAFFAHDQIETKIGGAAAAILLRNPYTYEPCISRLCEHPAVHPPSNFPIAVKWSDFSSDELSETLSE